MVYDVRAQGATEQAPNITTFATEQTHPLFISISAQKQARHAGDWAEGIDINALIQEAYARGVPFKGRADSLIYETGRVVGANGETQIIVRVAKKNIHGHPAAKVFKSND